MSVTKASKIVLIVMIVIFAGVVLLALFLPSPAVAPEESQILIEVPGELLSDEELNDEEFLNEDE